MSRFQGYVGIVNYMGGRFTASEQGMAPVLREAATRGLIYLDDGSSARSLAGQIAGANNLAFAKADLVIDQVPTPADVDRALGRLETLARARGTAVGFAGALPVSIDRISRWIKAAESRGIQLVPITAVVARAEVELIERSRSDRFDHTGQRKPWPDLDSKLRSPRRDAIRGHDECTRYESLPYRPCVGIMVINRKGRVFIGKRRGGPEHVDATHSWQMPQGGVDKGEDTYKAALRELHEETGIRSVEKLAEVPEWLSYDIPREIVGEAWKGKIPRADAEMVRAALHRQG